MTGLDLPGMQPLGYLHGILEGHRWAVEPGGIRLPLEAPLRDSLLQLYQDSPLWDPGCAGDWALTHPLLLGEQEDSLWVDARGLWEDHVEPTVTEVYELFVSLGFSLGGACDG